MINNYLLLAYRSMMKNKAFIIINIFGMGLAIAICIVSFLALEYDDTFDHVHKNRERIYRVSIVRTFENKDTKFGYANLPLGEIVEKTFSDVDYTSQYSDSQSNFKLGEDLFPSELTYVNPDFFKMFSFEFIAGSASAIADRNSVLINETMAVKLFHTPAEALGKTIRQVMGSEIKEVAIAGVFKDQPMNSSFFKRHGAAYMNFENYKDEFKNGSENDWHQWGTLYVQINNADRVASVHKQLQPYINNNNKVNEAFLLSAIELDKFSTMAANDREGDIRAQTWAAPPLAAIGGSVIMGILILLIACFNLTNTAIAISSRRLKEIGIRKVMGSVRLQLIIQFISETMLICAAAIVVGVAMTSFLIEGWNLMTGNNIHIENNYFSNPKFFVVLISMLFVTGLIAGSYPAFYISKFQPISVLKGKAKFGGTNYFTRTLLGLQFAISLISIVSAFGLYQNARYQREFDLGFDIRGSVIVPVNDQGEFETYRNALAQNPEILSITGANTSIGSFRLHEAVKHESRQSEVDIIEVGDDYLKTLDLKLTSGRDFLRNSDTDAKESIIITESMASLFNLTKPLGTEIRWHDTTKLFVVGVVKDVYTQGLWRDKDPMMIRYTKPEHYRQLIVNTKAENLYAVNDNMKTSWNKIFPNRLYPGRMLANDLQEIHRLNMSIVSGYGFLGLFALILSATGLFSLLSLNIVKRMKEIGVRKILGASALNVVRIVNTEFILIILIASAFGCWTGYAWANTIMGTIWRYYQGIGVMPIIMSIALILLTAGITIAVKAYAVATMNPVKTLKDE